MMKIKVMERIVKIFSSPDELATACAGDLAEMINARPERKYNIALSGGSTPELLYGILGHDYVSAVNWDHVHFFWGDERCVPPDSKESNYGMAKRMLFDEIKIPSKNIHRIHGEDDPQSEVIRYAEELSVNMRKRCGFPMFDLIILGLGEDGHTASIFPGNRRLLFSDRICETAVHPETGQMRITITGKVINNAGKVIFLVTGNKKAPVVEKLLKKRAEAVDLPANSVVPEYGRLEWYLDKEAASETGF